MLTDKLMDIIRSRLAAKELVRKAALKGNKICGGLLSLESFASSTFAGPYLLETQLDYSDLEEGEDM